jgi:lactoylglutathione lyase
MTEPRSAFGPIAIAGLTHIGIPNILLDVPDKHAGIPHFALLCPDIILAGERLAAAGIPLSGGPIRFGPRSQGIFVRDPDRNVIELHQRD